MRLFWKILRVAVELITAIALMVVLFGGAFMWRISESPLSLHYFLGQYNTGFSSSNKQPLKLIPSDIKIYWNNKSKALEILALNVQVADAKGYKVLRIPKVKGYISGRALLNGIIAPRRIKIISPQVYIKRNKQGKFSVSEALSAPTTPHKQPSQSGAPLKPLADIVSQFLATEGQQNWLSYLEKISIIDGGLHYKNFYQQAHSLRVLPINAVVRRMPSGIKGVGKATMTIKGEKATLIFKLSHNRNDESSKLFMSVYHLAPDSLGQIIPAFSPVLGMKDAINGNLSVIFNMQGVWKSITLEATSPFGAVTGGLYRAPHQRSMVGEFKTTGLRLNVLLKPFPSLLQAVTLDTPLGGNIVLAGSSLLSLDTVSFHLSGKGGCISLPAIFKNPQKLKMLSLQGIIDQDLQTLKLTKGIISFKQGPTLTGTARLVQHETGVGIALNTKMEKLSVQKLAIYWPPTVGVGVRQWVIKNVRRGQAENINVNVGLFIPTHHYEEKTHINLLSGHMSLSHMTIYPLRPFIPLTNVRAQMSLSLNRIDFRKVNANFKGVSLRNVHVSLENLQGKTPTLLKVQNIDAQGTVKDMEAIITDNRVGLVSKKVLAPYKMSGTYVVRGEASLPLSPHLTMKQVRLNLKGSLAKVRIKPFKDTWLSSSKLNFTMRNMLVYIQGVIKGLGQSVTVDWQENLMALKNEPKSQVHLVGVVEQQAINKLIKQDVSAYWTKGRIGIKASLKRFAHNRLSLTLKTDMTQAALKFKALDWGKPIGGQAFVKIKVSKSQASPIIISDVDLKAPQLSVDGNVRWNTKMNALVFARLDHFVMPRTQIKGVVLQRPDKGYDVNLQGKNIDISGFLKSRGQKSTAPLKKGRKGLKTDKRFKPFSQIKIPLSIKASVAHLYTSTKGRLDNVALNFYYNGQELEYLKASVQGGRHTTLVNYTPLMSRGHRLLVKSDNVGHLLGQLGMTPLIKRGWFQLDMKSSGRARPLRGVVTGGDFVIRNVPMVAKVLEFMSVSGAPTALRDEGLPFTKIEGQITFDPQSQRVTVQQARVYGDAIGVTGQGEIDIGKACWNIYGTIAPFYSLNLLLSHIPLVNKLFTAREGFIAASYRLEGPLESPQFTINPFKALAPGILRKIFD